MYFDIYYLSISICVNQVSLRCTKPVSIPISDLELKYVDDVESADGSSSLSKSPHTRMSSRFQFEIASIGVYQSLVEDNQHGKSSKHSSSSSSRNVPTNSLNKKGGDDSGGGLFQLEQVEKMKPYKTSIKFNQFQNEIKTSKEKQQQHSSLLKNESPPNKHKFSMKRVKLATQWWFVQKLFLPLFFLKVTQLLIMHQIVPYPLMINTLFRHYFSQK